MGRKRDQFWDYAEQRLDGRFKCNFCHGDFPGGATRIKAHLAGVSGHGIVACIAVSQEVQKEARATQETNKKLKCASSSSSANERKITSVSSSVSSSKIMDRIVTQSKEEYIVEIFLDDVVDRLVANVFSFTTEHSKNKELKNLLYTLCKIHVMLYDAQKRQVSDESVRIWLTELKDVVYEVDNALDKFSYDTFLKYQMMNQVPSISLCNFDKVKTINHALDNIVNEVDRLGLKIVNSNPKISLDNDDSEVIGREYCVLKSWDLLDDDDDYVFLKLKSRFDSLTISSLKRCFAYCAIFPKDYEIRKDELIQHWMAEGFLEPSKESMVMEDIGNKYFNILLDKSFLQNGKRDEYGNIISYRMHDSVHDFVLLISRSKSSTSGIFSDVRSLFVGFDGQTAPRISFKGDCFTKLCTLSLENADFGGRLLLAFKSLRVLKLYGYKKIELTESIDVLIHLRLLHITGINHLPNSITKLYNLQTLRIEGFLMELPKDLSNLINLRHICIDEIKKAPKNLGRLTCLQTLPIFVVGRDEGYRIKELGALKNLRGEIKISNLEKVEDEEEAKSAKLKEKEMFKLGLHWTSSIRAADSYDKDEKVLEGLQPHPNLKSLTIERYEGKKFPSWWAGLSLYQNLIEIYLNGCTECEEVPTLGHLPCLRVLEIIGMEKVRSIGSEFYSYDDGSYRNTTTLFPALRILKLVEMIALEEWKDAGEVLVFPCLEELTISYCNELRAFPDSLHTCVSLQKLRFFEIEALPECLGCLSSLQKLYIVDCNHLAHLPTEEAMRRLTQLKMLIIYDCPNLEDNERSKIDHIPFVDIQDVARLL
nr:disease resistance protein RGA2-like [Quercus suber]